MAVQNILGPRCTEDAFGSVFFWSVALFKGRNVVTQQRCKYLGGKRFESKKVTVYTCLRILMIFPSLFRRMIGMYLEIYNEIFLENNGILQYHYTL